MRLLLDHPWPGNVRELENSIEHAVVLSRGHRIDITDLPAAVRDMTRSTYNRPSRKMNDTESGLIQEVLDECGWNKKMAARRLGISRSTLYSKIRKYALTPATIH
jgi:two-component system response regulator HydG